ncbi:hypothetical protein CPC08DRAFT_131895 [Agrocybe pediades]|nr:hypothetical protein CPC08DRAFT_131895 [Agrocybe pediades]
MHMDHTSYAWIHISSYLFLLAVDHYASSSFPPNAQGSLQCLVAITQSLGFLLQNQYRMAQFPSSSHLSLSPCNSLSLPLRIGRTTPEHAVFVAFTRRTPRLEKLGGTSSEVPALVVLRHSTGIASPHSYRTCPFCTPLLILYAPLCLLSYPTMYTHPHLVPLSASWH